MKRFIHIGIIILLLISSGTNAQWVQTSGANGSTIWGIAVNSAGVFACYTARYDSAGVIRSTDFGINWSDVSTGLPLRETDALIATGSNLFVSENDAGVYLSTDNGANWNVTAINVEYIHGFATIGNNLFAASKFNGVYISTDNGTSWNFINSGLTNTQTRSIFTDGTNLFVGTYGGGGIFLSTNNGGTWSVINSGLTQHYVYSFTKIGSNLFAGTWSAGVFLSTNNGANWTAASNGLSSNYPVYEFVANGTNLFAATEGGGVYLSTNNGSNWTDVSSGLTNLNMLRLAISGSYLFAGGDQSGVWRRPLSEMITGINEKSDLPENYSLSQNYPNPFNPATTIKYSVSQMHKVTLKVYSALGKEVATLVNEEKPAGAYEVSFNGAGLASGVYYYKLTAGSYTDVRKMILIK